jgi:hypothetical protein
MMKTLVHPWLNGVLDSAEYLEEHFPSFYTVFLEGIKDNRFSQLYRSPEPQVNTMLFPCFEPVGTVTGSLWWHLLGVLIQQHTRCAVTYAFGRVGCTELREWNDDGYKRFVSDVVARVLTPQYMNQIQMREALYNTEAKESECFGEIVADQCLSINNTISSHMRNAPFMDHFSFVNDYDDDE